MRKTLITLTIALLTASPALANTCVIVVPSKGPHPDWFQWEPIYWHEIAHCNGWKHPAKAEPKGNGKGYTSFPVPPKYNHLPKIEVITRGVTIKEAQKLCGGHWGCQWME